METNFFNKGNAVTDTAENMTEHVGAATSHVLDATKEAGKQIGTVAHQEMASLKADLDQLIALLPSLSEVDLNAAKEKLLTKIEATKVVAKDMTADVREQFNHGVDVSGAYVKERPLQSVAVAAGVGILLGLLIARR
jgi:ElaB/YqjD/DUF883 family membrane-anchored ribosome-binding protein